MNDFITKPYDEQDFFRKIEHVLSLSYDVLKVEKPEFGNDDKRYTEAPLFDLSLLRQLSRGNEEFVQKMIAVFVNLTAENTEAFEDAIDHDDTEKIKKLAHKIKPSIDQLDIKSLKEVVREVEKYDIEIRSKDEMYASVRQIIRVLREVADQLGR
jgi:HPt (histidine-containing phosphotransfer) domain-containing protein